MALVNGDGFVLYCIWTLLLTFNTSCDKLEFKKGDDNRGTSNCEAKTFSWREAEENSGKWAGQAKEGCTWNREWFWGTFYFYIAERLWGILK